MSVDLTTIHCPHCNLLIVIDELNCCIFRCGIIKKTGTQIDPHESKEGCDALAQNGEIYGCGKPFRIIINGTTLIVEKCEYI